MLAQHPAPDGTTAPDAFPASPTAARHVAARALGVALTCVAAVTGWSLTARSLASRSLVERTAHGPLAEARAAVHHHPPTTMGEARTLLGRGPDTCEPLVGDAQIGCVWWIEDEERTPVPMLFVAQGFEADAPLRPTGD